MVQTRSIKQHQTNRKSLKVKLLTLMTKRFLNIVTTVLLAFAWAAPLCAAKPLTQAEVDAMYERIDALYEQGMSAYKAGEFSQTATLLTEAVSLQEQVAEDDDLLAMTTTLAVAQSQAGEYQAALTMTDKAIALAKKLHGEQAKELTQLESNRAYLQSKIDMRRDNPPHDHSRGGHHRRTTAVRRRYPRLPTGRLPQGITADTSGRGDRYAATDLP